MYVFYACVLCMCFMYVFISCICRKGFICFPLGVDGKSCFVLVFYWRGGRNYLRKKESKERQILPASG